MRHIDVFNGDADGLCALRQLRLSRPLASELVTGTKRDIALVHRVLAWPGDHVTVLDVDFDRNRDAVMTLLERGVSVTYFDHHGSPDLPEHPLLDAHVSSRRGVCTSLLVDRHLDGRHGAWAVVGAFGDGLVSAATERAASLGLNAAQIALLRDLGDSLNYNAYGDTEADLLLPPANLYRVIERYRNPIEFAAMEPVALRLSERRRSDLRAALSLPAFRSAPQWHVYVLPDEPWSRRVSGALATHLASSDPGRAYAVLSPGKGRAYRVSVRTPAGVSAARLCARFPGGGGRAGAGGIDELDARRVDDFVERLDAACRHGSGVLGYWRAMHE
jgi:hypothetical protein